MHASASKRLSRILTFIIATLFLAGCYGKGEGQPRILNSPVPPEPPVPPGFCDPVNFEPQCPQPSVSSNFEGGVTTVEDNPPDLGPGNDSLRVGRMVKFRADSGLAFGGSTLALAESFDVQAGSSFTMKVWSPRPVRVLFQPEPQGPGSGVEVTHGGTGWETMTFPLPALSGTVSGITLIFDNDELGDAEADPRNWTFYFDDITLVGGSGGPGPGGPPTTAAPTPPQDPANVISLYSDAYTNEATTWPTDWSDPNNTTSDITVAGGLVKEHLTINFVGVEFQVDATSMTHLHVDVWTPNADSLLLRLVDFGGDGFGGGNDTQGEVTFDNASTPPLAQGAWVSLDIPLQDFIDDGLGSTADLNQLVIDPTADGTDVYIDNVYFYNDVGGGGGTGIVPDVVIYATDPNVPVDLEFGVDYTGFDAFGSGSAFDNNVTTDADYNPAFGVTTGNGYGAQVGQFAIVGFPAGFATGYDSLVFKAKGLNNDLIRLKFLDDPNYLDIDLATSGYSTDLGNGWYQVEVPIADFTGVAAATGLLFETDNTAASAFTFLLTDIGFNVPAAGGGTGIVPDVVIYATDPNVPVDLVFGVDYTGFDAFGSGSAFDNNVTTDPDYNPAFGVTTGNGYGAQVGQFAIIGFAAGFATGYDSLVFKAKGLNNDLIRLKFLDDPNYLDIDLATSGYSTDLGNGWYQVEVPIADFTGVAAATGLLFETDNTAANAFTFLLTDIGFTTGGGGAGGEIAVNGGFETGDFTGWTQFEATPGDQTINTGMAGDTSSEGVFHLQINNTATGTNSLIKQERVGLGTVTPGIAWTVTFDARGSFDPGGVAFAQVFSETAMGNEPCTGCGILGGGPLAINADPTVWTSFTFSGSAGPNTESLTLQLEAVTGGGNLANMFYDNISIVVGP